MKRTLTINLNRAVYHIDEDAYGVLGSYLERLRQHFQAEEECREILDDIEARIAELFTERMRFGMQVISLADVEDVIKVMGQPEEFEHDIDSNYTSEEEHNDDPQPQPTPEPDKKVVRRLFRDNDNRILGGVASGISHYLAIDTVWVRILLVLFAFVWATSFWVYLILWIVVPVADTAAKRLQMRGEAVTVESIKNQVVDEMLTGAPSRTGGLFVEILRGLFKFFFILLGGFFAFIALIVLFSVGALLLGNITSFNMYMNPTPYVPYYMQQAHNIWMLAPALLLTFGIPLYLLARVLLGRTFKWQPQSKVLNYILLAFWIIGIVLLVVYTAQSFPVHFNIHRSIQII